MLLYQKKQKMETKYKIQPSQGDPSFFVMLPWKQLLH